MKTNIRNAYTPLAENSALLHNNPCNRRRHHAVSNKHTIHGTHMPREFN